MIWHSTTSNAMLLEPELLEQLVELADATVANAEERMTDGEPEQWVKLALDKTYAQGVRDALGWLAGRHSPDRLVELLDIDIDQR